MTLMEQMIEAVKSGDALTARNLLQNDPSLANARSASSEPAILLTVYHGHEDIAKALISAGAHLDIFEAAAEGQTEQTRALLQAQPELAASYSTDGWTPLHLAAFFGREEAAKLLIGASAPLNAMARNANSNTPLQAAAASRKSNLVKILAAAGTNVDAKTGYGWTALHIAARNGDMETVRVLVQASAVLGTCNDQGQTAASIAAEGGHTELAAYLEAQEQET